MVGGRFPAWALALCGGIVLALVIAMTTRSDKQPWGHFVSTSQQFATLETRRKLWRISSLTRLWDCY